MKPPAINELIFNAVENSEYKPTSAENQKAKEFFESSKLFTVENGILYENGEVISNHAFCTMIVILEKRKKRKGF